MSNATNLKDEESYPHLDVDGNYASYQEGGRWVNWWARRKPSLFTLFKEFVTNRDESGIPRTKEELDAALPVLKPYFANKSTSDSGEGPKKNAETDSDVRATWVGHATVLAEVGGTVLLTDPIFSDRASMFSFAGPKRYRPPACGLEDLPENLSAVIISHSHYDHLDRWSCRELNRRYKSRLHWFVPSGLGDWMVNNVGVDRSNVHEMVWWQEKMHPVTGARFVFTPTHHWGRRTAFDRNKALWGSWAVFGPEGSGSFWFGGDTAYCDVFEQIGRKLGPFDLAAIPIGNYSPRNVMKWHHVSPEEAVRIHTDLRCSGSLAIHWGTFKMMFDKYPYLEPRARLSRALEETGKDPDEFQAVNIGGTITANAKPQKKKDNN